MTLGKRIREKRKAKGMSGQQLGDVFGISRSSVSDWERGATRPDPDKLVRLAETLNTTVFAWKQRCETVCNPHTKSRPKAYSQRTKRD
jgi:transcriptional regulator with XRE-family HTH domain